MIENGAGLFWQAAWACTAKLPRVCHQRHRTRSALGPDGRRIDPQCGRMGRCQGTEEREKVHVKSDERILGDGDFVEKILSRSRERYERQYALKASGIDLDNVAARVAELLGMDTEQVWQPGNFRAQVQARSLLCYWAVRELGESMTAMAGGL